MAISPTHKRAKTVLGTLKKATKLSPSSSKKSGTTLETIDENKSRDLPHETNDWDPATEPQEEENTLAKLVEREDLSYQEVSVFFHERYTEFVAQEAEKSRSPLDIVLDASALLVDEFVTVNPQTDRVLLHNELDVYIFPRITLLYRDISKVQASDVAKLISWADHYQAQLASIGMKVSKHRLADFEELATEYLKRGVHDQMQIMIQNSIQLLESEDAIMQDGTTGRLITAHPEDIAFMVEMQLSVARETLPPRFLAHVLTACNDEIFNMVADLMLKVGSRWKQMEVERLCATINDALRLSEQCEERNEELVDVSNEEHVQSGEDVCKELTELALHATRYLCERIMLDLVDLDPILTSIGKPRWEQDNTVSPVDTAIVTLKDYFADIFEWVPDRYVFPKCVKHCFDMTLQLYIHSFFSHTMANGLLQDPSQASGVLQKDWQKLLQFFANKEMEEYAGCAGHYSKSVLVARLDLLQALSVLLTPTIPPNQMQAEIEIVLHQLGIEVGVPAVLHMAGLRQGSVRYNKNTKAHHESDIWHEMLQQVTEKLDQQEKPPRNSFDYKLPDLRNSEYIQRVRPSGRSGGHLTCENGDKKNSRPSLLSSATPTAAPASFRLVQRRPGLCGKMGESFRRATSRRGGGFGRSDRMLATWRDIDDEEDEQERTKEDRRTKEMQLRGSQLSQRAL